MERGDTVQYTRTFMFGKTSEETATVVAVVGNKVLLDNGDEFYNYKM